jgi:hypothetical protein
LFVICRIFRENEVFILKIILGWAKSSATLARVGEGEGVAEVFGQPSTQS